jgi:hypothetical protein
MNDPRLMLYRLVYKDIEILALIQQALAVGMMDRVEQMRAAAELKLLIGRARENQYSDG